jgi:hypothetical protein
VGVFLWARYPCTVSRRQRVDIGTGAGTQMALRMTVHTELLTDDQRGKQALREGSLRKKCLLIFGRGIRPTSFSFDEWDKLAGIRELRRQESSSTFRTRATIRGENIAHKSALQRGQRSSRVCRRPLHRRPFVGLSQTRSAPFLEPFCGEFSSKVDKPIEN